MIGVRSTRLSSLRPGAGPGDLRAWSRALDGVRVVGLGEATHGTRECFTLKHRIIEHLIAEHGTTVVAFEASEAAATAVDRWVTTGRGDARDALRGLGFWTWDTEEVLALLHTLRAVNRRRAPAGRVRFVGVDPQHPGASVTAVVRYLRRRGRPDLARAIRPLARRASPAVEAPADSAVRAALDQVASDPDADADVVAHAARVGRGALLRGVPGGAARFALRDRSMADGVLAAAERTAGPVAFWAHNGHVRDVADPVASAGAHLRGRLGRGYYALGLLLGQGSFRAVRSRGPAAPSPTRRVHRLGPAPPTTLEGRLLAERAEDHLIDLRDGPGSAPSPDWLREPSWTRSHGAVAPAFPALAATPIVAAAEFDGLAVIRESGPSVALPTPR